jgi:CxxC motif-containing protein
LDYAIKNRESVFSRTIGWWQLQTIYCVCGIDCTRGVNYETLSTMKALFSVILAFALCVGSAQAGPVRTAKNVAKSSTITAKNVAHSVVKGTRKAVHTVVNTLTP